MAVINAIIDYYIIIILIFSTVHQMAEEATLEFESTREKIAEFINARLTKK